MKEDFLRRISEGLVLSVTLTQARTPDVVLAAQRSGFDAVMIDLEHTAVTTETASMLCRTATSVGMLALVRVPLIDESTMVRLLDSGASGVIVPHIDTVDQARRVVDLCRLPPLGRRTPYNTDSVPGHPDLSPSPTELFARVNESTIVAAMIESPEGVRNASEIASVQGVDMLLVGPHDLALELGAPEDFGTQRFMDCLTQVTRAAEAEKVAVGIAGIAAGDLLTHLVEMGVRYVGVGTDIGLFQSAATARVEQLRKLRTS